VFRCAAHRPGEKYVGGTTIKHISIIAILCLLNITSCNNSETKEATDFNQSEIMGAFKPAIVFKPVEKKYACSSLIVQGGITGEAKSIDDYEILCGTDFDSSKKIMKAFMGSVQLFLEQNKAQVYGYNTAGDVSDFHLKYIIGKSHGGVLAYSSYQKNGLLRIVVQIYEESN
jgi:hypothetical protein